MVLPYKENMRGIPSPRKPIGKFCKETIRIETQIVIVTTTMVIVAIDRKSVV